MRLQPANVADLSAALAKASAAATKISNVNLSALAQLLAHTPGDMTATVETGIGFAALQAQLARQGQWLPLDPPNPETITVADVLDRDLSGPRRFGYGTIREHLLGVRVVLADGRIIRNGGKVVKNVAGYDLCKLFVGARGTLGVIVEATFKLRPLPEAEQFVATRAASLEEAGARLEAVLDSELTPVAFELFDTTVVLGFAGSREEVAWQMALAASLGFIETASLEHEQKFWRDDAPVQRASVPPSRLIETLTRLRVREYVARAGNGTIYYRGGAAPPTPDVPVALTRRIKDTYDPAHILPELSPYAAP